jgi:hypothetical protein
MAMKLFLKNPVRVQRIRRTQRDILMDRYDPDSEALIVILTPGNDQVNGGILSIASIYQETSRLKDLHQSEVLLCTVPGEPLLLRYSQFRNENDIFEFSEVLRYFRSLEKLMIHIPEYAVERFSENITDNDRRRLRAVKNIHINMMLQNYTLLPDQEALQRLAGFGKLTCTTAHERYSSLETRERLGIPLHKLSVWNSPELYERMPYSRKKNLMIASPDPNPHRKDVLKAISTALPSLEVVTIQNLRYEEFRKLAIDAKWALTFGEGLDGYFLETIFSGGVGFAVYNPIFFTQDFGELETVYSSYEVMKSKISSDVSRLNRQEEFTEYHARQHALCSKYYNRSRYLENLRLFYEGRYSFP